MLAPDQLIDALMASNLPISNRAAQFIRGEGAQVTSYTMDYAKAIAGLKARREIKHQQAMTAKPENENIAKLRDALDTLISWWEANSHEQVICDSIATDSATCFIFWRQASSGAIITGVESRDAIKLTAAEGKAFWGDSWAPVPYEQLGISK